MWWHKKDPKEFVPLPTLTFIHDQTDLKPNQGAGYFSFVNFGGRKHLYFRRRRDYSHTIHAVSEDGLQFKICKPVLSNSYACHNFSAFLGPGRKLEGIGGQIGPGPMPHNRGLYHFTSEDGFQFEERRLLISGNHPGYVNGMSWGLEAELDGHHCCLYDPRLNKRILFLRANPARGKRLIQASQETPGGDFGAFRLINIRGDSLVNYYTANFFDTEGVFFGIIPALSETMCSLRLICSVDYISWHICGDLFRSKPWRTESGDPKNTEHPVQGVNDTGDFIEFYVHHNFLGADRSRPVSVDRYKVQKAHLLTAANEALYNFRWLQKLKGRLAT